MKKSKLTKIIASFAMVMSIFAISPVTANAEWVKDNKGWWYTEGDSWAMGWKYIDGAWYFFNSDGYMAHDTTIDGYKLNSNGKWIKEIIMASIGDEKITKDDFDKEININNFILDSASNFENIKSTCYFIIE